MNSYVFFLLPNRFWVELRCLLGAYHWPCMLKVLIYRSSRQTMPSWIARHRLRRTSVLTNSWRYVESNVITTKQCKVLSLWYIQLGLMFWLYNHFQPICCWTCTDLCRVFNEQCKGAINYVVWVTLCAIKMVVFHSQFEVFRQFLMHNIHL